MPRSLASARAARHAGGDAPPQELSEEEIEKMGPFAKAAYFAALKAAQERPADWWEQRPEVAADAKEVSERLLQ